MTLGAVLPGIAYLALAATVGGLCYRWSVRSLLYPRVAILALAFAVGLFWPITIIAGLVVLLATIITETIGAITGRSA